MSLPGSFYCARPNKQKQVIALFCVITPVAVRHSISSDQLPLVRLADSRRVAMDKRSTPYNPLEPCRLIP